MIGFGMPSAAPGGVSVGGGYGGASSVSDLAEVQGEYPRDHDTLAYRDREGSWGLRSSDIRTPDDLTPGQDRLWLRLDQIVLDAEGRVESVADASQGITLSQPDAISRPMSEDGDNLGTFGGDSGWLSGAYPQVKRAEYDEQPSGDPLSLSLTTSSTSLEVYNGDLVGSGELVVYDWDAGASDRASYDRGLRRVAVLVNGTDAASRADVTIYEYGSGGGFYIEYSGGGEWTLEIHYHDMPPAVVESSVSLPADSWPHTVVVWALAASEDGPEFRPAYSFGTTSEYVSYGFVGNRPAVKTATDMFVCPAPIPTRDCLVAFRSGGWGTLDVFVAVEHGPIEMDRLHREVDFVVRAPRDGEVFLRASPEGPSAPQTGYLFGVAHVGEALKSEDILSLMRAMTR